MIHNDVICNSTGSLVLLLTVMSYVHFKTCWDVLWCNLELSALWWFMLEQL
jgi:hypothetical protein